MKTAIKHLLFIYFLGYRCFVSRGRKASVGSSCNKSYTAVVKTAAAVVTCDSACPRNGVDKRQKETIGFLFYEVLSKTTSSSRK